MNKALKIPVLKLACSLLMLLSISACGERMVPAGIMGYNHTVDRPIYNFTVNGAMGHNISPGGGGGSESCCVSIPERWRPGLKATIAWTYDSFQTDPNPPPPSQKVEMEIPQYNHPGNFQIHFYADHKIKVVISPCGLGHPFHPMSEQDKLPWKDEYSKEEAIESFKKGGPSYEC